MTREDILAMVPGPELDRLVATEVKGITPYIDSEGSFHNLYYVESKKAYRLIPKYSTDIAAAWEVVERINHHIIEISKREKIRGYVTYRVWVFTRSLEYPDECWDRLVQVEGKTAPEAICKAALLSKLGVE